MIHSTFFHIMTAKNEEKKDREFKLFQNCMHPELELNRWRYSTLVTTSIYLMFANIIEFSKPSLSHITYSRGAEAHFQLILHFTAAARATSSGFTLFHIPRIWDASIFHMVNNIGAAVNTRRRSRAQARALYSMQDKRRYLSYLFPVSQSTVHGWLKWTIKFVCFFLRWSWICRSFILLIR